VQREVDVCEVLLETYTANDCMNQLLLEYLDESLARQSRRQKLAEGRTLAGIFPHLHNNRLSWIKNSAKRSTMPVDAEEALSNGGSKRVTRFCTITRKSQQTSAYLET
jgi:hypothetical protein